MTIFPDHAALDYDDRIVRLVPGYPLSLDLMACMLATCLNGPCRILVPGCGTGAEVLALAREADVMVDNYRPGVLRRYGVGYDDVKTMNPRIIYCAISGYGHSDAARTPQGAYDHVIQALTGMTMLSGMEGDPPLKAGFPVIDADTPASSSRASRSLPVARHFRRRASASISAVLSLRGPRP